jgi:hypothetical protein
MSLSTIFHDFTGGVKHVFTWVFEEEPKVKAEVEKVVIEIQTYVGSNKFLSAIASPIETELKAQATAFVNSAKATLTSGGSITADAATIATNLRAAGSSILGTVESSVAPQVAALGGSGSTLKLGLNAAWATFGPQIESFVTGLL